MGLRMTSTTAPVLTAAAGALAWPKPEAAEFSDRFHFTRALAPKASVPLKLSVPGVRARLPLTVEFGVTVPEPPKVALVATVTFPPAAMLAFWSKSVPALTLVVPV